MSIYIAENIRRLRSEQNLTQEALADFLGVTAKAVSKWETGENYPDITLLSPIANTLGVTIDELIGNDKIRSDERIDAIIAEYESLETALPARDREKNALARTAYREFPNDWRVIHLRLHSLFCGYDDEMFEEEKPLLRKLARLILDKCPIQRYRNSAIHALLYVAEDEAETERWLSELPSDINFWQLWARTDAHLQRGRWTQARECQLGLVREFAEYTIFALSLLTQTSAYGCDIPDECRSLPDESAAIYEKMIAVTTLIFGDERSEHIERYRKAIVRLRS
ncbi:MAG: helix-turn-helix domain-containing protein [Oscillospiraceae bacterium]|jgi:transcriptional regulator with XRE-family HTH domain|nr:helix-turn-helix domain-containing protein [Oscillospiraceae bacterium]